MVQLIMVKEDEKTWRRKHLRAWRRLFLLNALLMAVCALFYVPFRTISPALAVAAATICLWYPIGIGFALSHFIQRALIEPNQAAVVGLIFSCTSLASWFLLVARFLH